VSSFAADFPGRVSARLTRVATFRADARPARMVAGAPVAPVVEPAAAVGAVAVGRHGKRPHSVRLPMLRPLNPCGSSLVHGGHTEHQDRRQPAAAVDLDILLVLFVTPFSFVIDQSTLASTTYVFTTFVACPWLLVLPPT
jgi:hypothetical protein